MEDRIARLERRCRNLTTLIGLLLAGILLVPLLGADDAATGDEESAGRVGFYDILHVKKLHVVDDKGEARITLGVTLNEKKNEMAFIGMKSEKSLSYWLATWDDCIEQKFYDHNSKTRVHTAVVDGGGYLTLLDQNEKIRAGMMSDKNGLGGISVMGSKGQVVEDFSSK